MKKLVVVGLWALLCAGSAFGYEYHLNGTLSSGRAASTLGEQFNTDGTVSGLVSYQYRTCSRFNCSPWEYFCDNSGKWDAQGNLLSTKLTGTPSRDQAYGQSTPCAVPAQIGTASATTPAGTPPNTEEVYAQSGTSTTGKDTRGFGYLDIKAPHITAETPSNRIYVIPYAPDTFQIQYLSDGDFPVKVSGAVPTLTFSSPYNQGKGTMTVVATGESNDCLSGPVASGTSCMLNVTYEPTTITCTTSPYGYAYEHWAIKPISDAGNIPAWLAQYTITGVPSCNA